MKLIIEIEQGEYDHIKNGRFDYWSAEAVHKAISNGTPINEGDLISKGNEDKNGR